MTKIERSSIALKKEASLDWIALDCIETWSLAPAESNQNTNQILFCDVSFRLLYFMADILFLERFRST